MLVENAIKYVYTALDRMNRELIEARNDGEISRIIDLTEKIRLLWDEVHKLEEQKETEWNILHPQNLMPENDGDEDDITS